MLQAVIAEGLQSRWKEALELPTAEALNKAKVKIKNRIVEALTRRTGDRSLAQTVARMYLEVGSILAEHRAISKAAEKIPMLRNAAPEVLTPKEAVELMKYETLAPIEKWGSLFYLKISNELL